MIYDCFIFFNELEILDLRLSFLNDTVDHFVLVESGQTLTGQEKPLYFKENQERYEKYRSKIIYLECPRQPGMGHWDYEYFQRNFIQQGLLNCHDEDIILISDVDEIVNLKGILSIPGLQMPSLISLPMYSFFLNLRSNIDFAVNLLGPYSFIKDFYLGRRLPDYTDQIKNIIKPDHQFNTGWHFTSLFGLDYRKYVYKIQSYAHAEFNTPYYCNPKRIETCVKNGIDIFEQGIVQFKFIETEKYLGPLLPHISPVMMVQYIYQPDRQIFNSLKSRWFRLRHSVFPSARYKTKEIIMKFVYRGWNWVKFNRKKN